MRFWSRVLNAAVTVMLLAAPFAGFLSAQQSAEKLYVVTHVDLMPSTTADGKKLLQQFMADSLHDRGVVRFELLQENEHLNHFTIVEVWENEKAFEAHEEAAHTRQFREKLQPMLGSPFDTRYHHIS
jgi:quinol monooxygenase YgiN